MTNLEIVTEAAREGLAVTGEELCKVRCNQVCRGRGEELRRLKRGGIAGFVRGPRDW